VADQDDPSLLDRITIGWNCWRGLAQTSAGEPPEYRPVGHDAWVQQQYQANPGMGRDYLQAAAMHPYLFRHDTAAIIAHVEPVVSHFAPDGLNSRRSSQSP
jgi:hypothetical protein